MSALSKKLNGLDGNLDAATVESVIGIRSWCWMNIDLGHSFRQGMMQVANSIAKMYNNLEAITLKTVDPAPSTVLSAHEMMEDE